MEYFNVSKLARNRKELSRKILIIGGKAWSIVNFRGSLIKKLIEKGYEVTAIASEATSLDLKKIKNLGARYLNIDLKSNTVSVFKDISYFFALKNIILKLSPDIIISYTMKPVIYSGLVIFFQKKINFYPLITGLGSIFNTNKIILYPVKIILIFLCKILLRNAKTIIFQNRDNLKYFNNCGIAPKVKKIIISGSGVDINHFNVQPFNKKNITFLLIARLLRDKGIIEYIEAAKIIKSKIKDINFNLVGPKDNSYNKVDFNFILKNHNEGIINYFGQKKNVKPFITKCHVYVLPSYHEGLPRSVLEAMSMGRPILTTNVPGCKETVLNNKNGFLVPSKNVRVLVKKMTWFINNRKEIFKMGKKSRYLVEEKFTYKKINEKFIKLFSN